MPLLAWRALPLVEDPSRHFAQHKDLTFAGYISISSEYEKYFGIRGNAKEPR